MFRDTEANLIDTAGLVEIRWHGRGGQGAVTSTDLLARAAIAEGKNAQGFPSFGPERRGAPVVAFDRIDTKEPIRIRAEIAEPDVVIVLDPTLLNIVDVTAGLKPRGALVINTRKGLAEIEVTFGGNWQLAVLNASLIARVVVGVPIVNTTMLGALLRIAPVVAMDALVAPLEQRFGRLAGRNIDAMKRAFQETVVKE